MASDVRDLEFLAWQNNLAWMEKQSGSEWDAAIQNENAAFTKALEPLEKTKKFKEILETKPKTKSHPFTLNGWDVKHDMFSPNQVWKFKGTKFTCNAWDADAIDGFFAAAVPDPKGFERFSVEIYSTEKGFVPVRIANLQICGPQVAWIYGVLVYLGSSKDLRYDKVYSWDPKTKHNTLLFSLDDPVKNLELGRAEDGSVYVAITDFVNTRIGFILPGGIDWQNERTGILYVQSSLLVIDDSTQFPGLPEDPIEAISLKAGWAITRHYGIRTLWRLNDAVERIITVWGEISFDTRVPTQLYVKDVRYEPYVLKTTKWMISNPEPYDFAFSQYSDVLPTFVVHPRSTAIKGLLVTAYGAYGSPTKIGSLVPRWRPLLEEGWAIASVCVPGSGDHDTKWIRKGQRLGRGNSIKLFAETIKKLQEELGVSSAATALYGRSAGGLLVISTATLNTGLVGALYVESPYVDVLRTISNPELPLTLLETKEFGIGTNPMNMIATGAWSPIEHIPEGGIPELYVVARSDTADLEVYPYEVVKWIQKVRGLNSGHPKLLYVNNGKGHFTTDIESRAEDLALLDNYLSTVVRINNHTLKYKMPNRKNRTRRNRNNATRKNRNNAANSTMMGGRRKHRGGYAPVNSVGASLKGGRRRNNSMRGGWFAAKHPNPVQGPRGVPSSAQADARNSLAALSASNKAAAAAADPRAAARAAFATPAADPRDAARAAFAAKTAAAPAAAGPVKPMGMPMKMKGGWFAAPSPAHTAAPAEGFAPSAAQARANAYEAARYQQTLQREATARSQARALAARADAARPAQSWTPQRR